MESISYTPSEQISLFATTRVTDPSRILPILQEKAGSDHLLYGIASSDELVR